MALGRSPASCGWAIGGQTLTLGNMSVLEDDGGNKGKLNLSMIQPTSVEWQKLAMGRSITSRVGAISSPWAEVGPLGFL